MHAKFLLPSLAALLLTACGGGKDADPEAAETTPAPATAEDGAAGPDIAVTPAQSGAVPLVSVTEVLGTFEGAVTGLAVWRNPDTVFESLVLAANGEAGLYAVPIGEQPATDAPGTFAQIAVGYGPGGALLAAGERDTLRLFALSAAGPIPLSGMRLPGEITGLCFVDDAATVDARHLIALTEAGQRLVRIGGGEGGTSIGVEDLEGPTIDDCAGQADALLVLEEGRIRSAALRPSDDGSAPVLETDSFALQPTAPLRDMAVMPTDAGPVPLYILRDGRLQVGSQLVRIDEFDSTPLTHVAAGGGNYGTVFRGGIVAVITEENTLGVVPWLVIANELGLDSPTITAGPQDPVPSGIVLDAAPIEVPDIDLPPGN